MACSQLARKPAGPFPFLLLPRKNNEPGEGRDPHLAPHPDLVLEGELRTRRVAACSPIVSTPPPRRVARLALDRADGSSIERRVAITPVGHLEQRHLRALRSACQSLRRELAESPLGVTGWATQLLTATDEALELLGREVIA